MIANKKSNISNYQVEWEIAQKYSYPNTIRSSFEYILSWFLFLLNSFFIFELLKVQTFYTIPLIILQSLNLVRIFILQHDCGHNALFKKSYLNNIAGIICSSVSSITFHFWKDSHAIHHKINGNLNKRPWIGGVEILTLNEFKILSESEKKLYLFKRNLFVVLSFGWIYHIYNHRIYTPRFKNKLMTKKHLLRIHLTNAFQISIFTLIAIFISPKFLFLAIIIPMILGLIIGIFLFFIQHNFERSYFFFETDEDINRKEIFMKTSMSGSSCLILPNILRWFTGNIGYHHIHHISAKIPFYKLNKIYDTYPEIRNVTKLTLRNALKQFSFVLYDSKNQKLITIKEYQSLNNLKSLN